MEIERRTRQEGSLNELAFDAEKCSAVQQAELVAWEESGVSTPLPDHVHDPASCYTRTTDIHEVVEYFGVVDGTIVTDAYTAPEDVAVPSAAEIASKLPPDLPGFKVAMTTAVGIVRANTLINENPAIMLMLEAGNWAFARVGIEQTLAASGITKAERDGLIALMDAHHLGEPASPP